VLSGRIICLVLVLSMSGCLSSPTGDDRSIPDTSHSPSFTWALVHPYVINATESGSITYSYTIRSDCPFKAMPFFSYVVYDKYGFVTAKRVDIDLTSGAHGELFIPLEGTPPFVLAGQANACVKAGDSSIAGITSGHRLWSRSGYDLDASEVYKWTNFTIPSGARFVQRPISHPEWSWMIDAAGPDVRMPPATSGQIMLYYADGKIARVDDYSLTTGHGWRFAPFQWTPSPMEIVVELDRPVVDPVNVSYIARYLVFHREICEHGLEWDLCA
jgi:hypothetical protein